MQGPNCQRQVLQHGQRSPLQGIAQTCCNQTSNFYSAMPQHLAKKGQPIKALLQLWDSDKKQADVEEALPDTIWGVCGGPF